MPASVQQQTRLAFVGLTGLLLAAPIQGQLPAPPADVCVSRIEQDATRWCLIKLGEDAASVAKSSIGGETLRSEPIPIRRWPLSAFELAFDSVWIAYSARSQMGLLQLDAETLTTRSDIRMRGSSTGVIAVGSDAIWVLAWRGLHGELRRVDPRIGEVVDTVELDVFGHDLIEVDGAVWIAASYQVVHLDAETLTVERTFAVPPGVGIPSVYGSAFDLDLPTLPKMIVHDGHSVLVGIGELCTACFLGGRFNGPGDPILTGRVDIDSGSVVLLPNDQVAWPLY